MADFEPPIGDERAIKDDRVVIVQDSPKATRGRGCLRIDLTPAKPVRLSFILSGDELVSHDWLEYDVVGAAPTGVLVETSLSVEGDDREEARAGTVVDCSPWRGQLLLTDLIRGRVGDDVRVTLEFRSLGPGVTLHFDALRLVRDRPPRLPSDAGGAFDFGDARGALWPGFALVDTDQLRLQDEGWHWDSARLPQVSSLTWPDPLRRDFLGADAPDRPETPFSLSLHLQPGQYEGVIFAAPVFPHGLKRAAYSLICNGALLIHRDWPIERMFTEDGVFAGRDALDFGAEAVRQSWVDTTFEPVPFSVSTYDGVVTFDSLGTYLAGLIIHPRKHHKVFSSFVERLAARQQAYFAQQVYSCARSLRPEPLDPPTEDERASGVQILTARPLELADPAFEVDKGRLVRDQIELFGLVGQTVTTAIGVLALEDVQGLELQTHRGQGGSARIQEIRDFPMMWRPPVRRATPYWLSDATPRQLAKGQMLWYLVEADIPSGGRGKDLLLRLRVNVNKRPMAKLSVKIAVGPTRMTLGELCYGVVYPHEQESGYLLTLVGPTRESDVGTLILDDYRVLKEYALGATTIQGVYIGSALDDPMMYVARALVRARIVARAGLCDQMPGWVDFSTVAADRHWQQGPDRALVEVAAETFRGIRSDLTRMGINASALLASDLSPRRGADNLTADQTMVMARLLRESGWRRLGVMFNPWAWGQEGREDEAELGELARIVGDFDRVVAPPAVAVPLRKRWKDLDIELLDPSADRFASGFGLWLAGLNGLWTMNVHRRTIPYLPLESAHPIQQPLLIPFPRRPAPTLRLLSIREGAADRAYIALLERLVAQKRPKSDALDQARKSLEDARREIADAYARAVEGDPERDPDAPEARVQRRPAPPQALMDKHRRELFNAILRLARHR
ncbi:MAG: hypothetical protein JXQ73_22810 [Phycisphaerae bacterium]|nr:hypothetical protein [Phycisphaerae bacterium]